MAIRKKSSVNPNPLISAGWISKVFFWWLKDLIRYGRKQDLIAENVYDTTPEDLSESLRDSLEIAWQTEINEASAKKRKASLWKAVVRTYFWDFLKLSTFTAGSTIIVTIGPCLLELMMSYFHPTSTMTQSRAYLNATAFVTLMVLRSVLDNHGFFHLSRLGMRAKIACSSLIYKKMVRLSVTASQNYSSSIINLLTSDVTKFETFFILLPFVFLVPIQLIGTTYLIWQIIDCDATLVSIALMIFLTVPVLVLYSEIFVKFRTKQTLRTDKRLSLISEVVNGIRAIKMYVWEKYFEECVRLARRLEIKSYLNVAYITSVVEANSSFCYRLCVFVVILIYVPQYGMLSANKILPIAQHFYNLQDVITKWLFLGLRRIADTHVSMMRIENFMLLQEMDPNVGKIADGTKDKIILMKNVTVSWDDQSPVLKNIHVNIAPKQLYAVVGTVGSGKSLFLKLILGEIRLSSGEISVYGKISYASQEPWLFPASVKDNILFGEIYNEEKYNKVVSACALLDDFTQLPYADKTLVGDRGMSLSGGQCARINLARAVYRDADIYLFDNPLSAVDTCIAKKLMAECINGLLKDKTRILVTHSIELLRGVDNIIFLNFGTIEFTGYLDNFRKNHRYLKQLPSDETETLENGLKTSKQSNIVINSLDMTKEPEESDELIAKGVVKMSVYTRHIKAGGLRLALLIILLNCIFIMSVISFDYGLVTWIQNKNSSSLNEIEYNTTTFSGNIAEFSSPDRYATLLLGIIILVIVVNSILINISANVFMLYASNNIHNNMFSQLLKTTLRFFEMNTSGRILNRFSEDTRIADDYLPKVLLEATQSAFFVTALLLSAVIANWWIIISSGILIYLFILILRTYVAIIQQLTRLMGNAKSPVLSFVASSLAGLTTIRACKAERIVSQNFDSRQDRHTAAQFLVLALKLANLLWIELTSIGLLASTIYICIHLKSDDTVEGFVGLALMQIMNMTTYLSNTLIRIVQALSSMPNIERMLQFTELQSEDIISNKSGLELPISWPDKGEIKFEKLYLRYSKDNNPVLWNLNFTIVSGSKVGIVGRTGAGKSTLISAIFRLAKFEGSLLIDGIDINKVSLSKLRSNISVIPQEPFLFKATLRRNLDPNDEFDDALLWSALEDVGLEKLFDTLSSAIDSGGSNLSLGQRQLLCLARAILKKNQILILDEATANIDLTTDTLIQTTIRSKFKECTVLTIAHRLDTVMDSDKILVMDNGKVAEYDHPSVLLQNNDGLFSKMIQRAGNVTAEKLKAIAEEAYR